LIAYHVMAGDSSSLTTTTTDKRKIPLEILGGIVVAVILFIIILILFPSSRPIPTETCGAGRVGLRAAWPSSDGGSLFVVIENFGKGTIKHGEAMPVGYVRVSGDTSVGKFSRNINSTDCTPTLGWHETLDSPAEGNYSRLLIECKGLGLNASIESMLKAEVTLSCGAVLNVDVNN